jgi:hypothetical protein
VTRVTDLTDLFAKGNEQTLIDYWTHGEGGQEIRWGVPGDFDRCVSLVTVKAHGKVPDVKGYCANLHHKALGVWPGREHAAGPQLPDLITIPGVDLLAAGTWDLSTGRQTFTRDDLASAVTAAGCPAVGNPVIKIGHLDERFAPAPGQDGEPSIGHVANMRLDPAGMKVIGDLAGMPGWLAAVSGSAFPSRSIEGAYGFKCQIGHEHPFVITAVALLGITQPGVGVLSGLPDVASLYGLSAASGWRTPPEETFGGPVVPVTEEDVRRAYYANADVPQSWWITELQMAPTQLVVTDGEGKIYRVPFQVDGSSVTFGDATEVASYGDLAAARGTGAAVAYASAEVSRTVTAGGWDGGAAEKNLGDSPPAGTIRKLYALPAATKADSKLPHHDVSPGGEVGGPNAAACSAAIGAINGGRGGLAGISAGQAKAAYTHLAGHLKALGQEPPAYSGPAASAAQEALDRLHEVRDMIRDAVAAAGTATDNSIARLVTALDATIEQVQALIPADTSSLPDGVQQAVTLLGSAESISDELMSMLNIPDTDTDAGGTSASRRITARHGTADVTHSHPHSAFGAQGSDATHDHQHTHSGDGTHNHAHATAATGTTRKGGSEVEFTDEQNAALRAHLALGETGDLTPEVLITAVEALRGRADAKIAAGAKHLPEGVIAIEREAWDELNRRVAAGEAYRRKQAVAERDTVIAAAISDGKFTPARRQHWVRLWDADPEGTRIVLAGLQRNVVPLEDIGSAGGGMADELLDDEYKRLFPPGMLRDETS